MSPLISIIVPVFNRAHLIGETIASVMHQSFPTWELWLVDDHSTDGIDAVIAPFLESDERIHFVKRPANQLKGANTCRNLGFDKAMGDFVIFLDSDDLLHADYLKLQLENVQKQQSDLSVCQGNYFIKTAAAIEFSDHLWSQSLLSNNRIHDMATGKLRWPILAVLWKKERLPSKPFKEGLMNSQEWLFHIQMISQKIKIATLEKPLCHIRQHSFSMSNSINKNGQYYYHASNARYFAAQSLSNIEFKDKRKTLGAMLKRHAWYHFFSLYRGSIKSFVVLCKNYPKLLLYRFF